MVALCTCPTVWESSIMLHFQRLYPAIFRVKFNILTLTYETWKESRSACSGDYYCVRVKHLLPPLRHLSSCVPALNGRWLVAGFFPAGIPDIKLIASIRNIKLHFDYLLAWNGSPWPGKNVGYLLSLSDNSVILTVFSFLSCYSNYCWGIWGWKNSEEIELCHRNGKWNLSVGIQL